MFKTPVIVPNTSIPQRIGSENKRTLRTSRPTPLLPNPPTTHVPPKNHTHPADLPSTPCADTYFTNSPSRPNMQPLNPPPPLWATRTRATPRGLAHLCRTDCAARGDEQNHIAMRERMLPSETESVPPQQHARKLSKRARASTTQGTSVQPAL